MTIRLDMIRAAARAKNQLADSTGLVVEFIKSQINPDGGFKGRTGQSDLYYAVFGIESLLALKADTNAFPIADYLLSFADGKSLDFVHLACLARCRANIDANDKINRQIASRIELFRSEDGGYNNSIGQTHGTAYACFLALGASQDMGIEMSDKDGLLNCIDSLKKDDGSYTNEITIQNGSTPATAAAITTLHHLDQPIDTASAKWILDRSRATGGILATPTAPIPDLLSTATAIHALATVGTDIKKLKQPTLEFIDSLWSVEGAFSGNWLDDSLDCEYTFYALLALGHLDKI